MAVQWTKEQQQAIEARGSNILVAAAAGSGKTAVLVERIIQRICDATNPVSVDRLLVLTFTEAAAGEMKRKIATAMEQRLREEPENRWLRDQSLQIPSAHISTVHAFCKTMLQNHIHKTVLPADFSIIDDAENAVLRNQALDQVLEGYYQRIDRKEGFRDLAVGYGGTKSDENLRAMVLKLHNFVRSLAFPERWLCNAAEQYQTVCRTGTLQGTVWEQLLLEVCRELVQEIQSGLLRIFHIVEAEVPSDHKYFSYYTDLLQQFRQIFAPVLEEGAGVPVLRECQRAFEVPRTPNKTGLDESTVERINRIKKQLVTEPLGELRLLLAGTEPERIERIMACSSRIQALKQLVRQTERRHKALKRERSVLDFSDLEHEMMHLLADRKGRPTEVARQLQEYFVEILVDEYQDTNNIQDTMFRLLSRGEKNIFMVGDLKQSIYRFRNADPGIFAEKYRRYCLGEGGVCIRLLRNFRSRSQVVDSVNGIFSAIMKQETGGLDYTREEYLISGREYPEAVGDFATELLLTDAGAGQEDGEGEKISSGRLEAVTIAKRIRQLVDGQELQITDAETGLPRKVRLGDITVLVRNKSRVAEMEQVLAEYQIPTISEVGQKYLDSLEVLTVLNFLQIIDNPRQDIPLLAVLRSAIFRFSPEELAEIRLSAEGDFYTALSVAAEQGNISAAEFLRILEELRNDAVYQGVDQLIWKICYDLHYMDLVGAMPGGRVRQANLNLLYERGAEFEQGSLRGLFRFMAYIESLRSDNRDMKAATAFSDAENTVSIMTIHKSKGLEYPVVILCNMDMEFNERDAAASVLWHENAGLAMEYIDTNLRVRYPTLARQLVREKMLRDSRAEEMRLFYVAMTRAKEKLILSTLIGTKHDAWKKTVPVSGMSLPVGTIRRLRSMRDWTLACLLSHPKAEELRRWAEYPEVQPEEGLDFDLCLRWGEGSAETVAVLETKPFCEMPVSETRMDDMTKRLEYEYPHGILGKIPIKLSVSELKRRSMPEEDYIPSVLQMKQVVLTELTQLGSAERGTITHYVMQHMDFSRTETVEEVADQLEKMVDAGFITNRQRKAVSAQEIFAFFQHPLGRRLKASAKVEREFDFYMEISACELEGKLPKTENGEKVLLQGIADCFFYEGDGVVLIDYKTDRIPPEEAEERGKRYAVQMEYYTRGLQAVLECPVRERYLYFLHCGRAIAL